MAEYYAQPVEYPTPPPQPDGRVEPRPENVPAHAHEGTDVEIRPLVYLGVGLVIFLVATCIFLVFMFDLFSVMERRDVTIDSGLDGVPIRKPVDVPPLQGVPGTHANTPIMDQMEFTATNRLLLSSYSVARDGVARIPVSKAMEIALERKLFKTAPATPAATAPAAGAVPAAGADAHGTQSKPATAPKE